MNVTPAQFPQEVQAISFAAPRPWGKWSLRAVAAIYLGVMIVLPLTALLEHGLRDG
jgi:ABC-type sulfate transport system permease subunit